MEEVDGRLLLHLELGSNTIAGIDEHSQRDGTACLPGEVGNLLSGVVLHNRNLVLIEVRDSFSLLVENGKDHIDEVDIDDQLFVCWRGAGCGRRGCLRPIQVSQRPACCQEQNDKDKNVS